MTSGPPIESLHAAVMIRARIIQAVDPGGGFTRWLVAAFESDGEWLFFASRDAGFLRYAAAHGVSASTLQDFRLRHLATRSSDALIVPILDASGRLTVRSFPIAEPS